MEINQNRNVYVGWSVVVILGLATGYWWINRGYSEVSSLTYEFSKSLYSACLKKSEVHLAKAAEMLAETDESSIPSHERKWLEQIIKLADDGNWKTATLKSKRLMEAQVDY